MADPASGTDPTLVVEDATLVMARAGSVPEPPASVAEGGAFLPSSGEHQVLAGRYEILGLIGSGGMGTVYRAHDRELDETVAVKLLRRELADVPATLEGFRREARLARRVTHPSVARVFDIGEHAGDRFLTMEFVDGESLAALLARTGMLDLARALAIVGAVAAGLASAHDAGVVHRDLKPDNVLIGRDGRVVVTDFGIARAILEAGAGAERITGGAIIGTPAYMAPEQVLGLPVDARADVYALGVLLYELCTGKHAWTGSSPYAIASARLLAAPPDPRRVAPGLPAPVAELILHCMATRAEDRPESIHAVIAALAAVQRAPPAPPVSVPATQRAAPAAVFVPPERERPADKTVAVLPFRNAGAPDDAYLAEELTDDLIDALSMTRGLRVSARSVVSRYGESDDPREIGRALGVQVVALGSVRRGGGRVRVSMRLVSVADAFQLWAKRIERPEQEVLAINDDVARAIAEALTLDGPGSSRDAPSNPAAIDLYIRGRHEYRKFWPEHQRRAVALFEQAAVIVPDDPTILSGLALALSRLAFFSSSSDRLRAREAAERAVAAAPQLSESHLALGSVLLQMEEPKAAVRELKQAVGRGPGLAEAHSALGRLLVEAGAVDEGIWRLDAALGLDPDVPLACAALLRAFALLGRWEAVDRLFPQVQHDTIVFWALGARTALWRRVPASAYVHEVPRDVEGGLLWAMGEAIRSGALPEGAPTLEDLHKSVEGTPRRRVLFYQMYAELHAYAGDGGRALDALRCAADAGLIDIFWLDRCPLFDPLRGDARFAAARAPVSRRAEEILEAYRAA